MTIYSKPNYDTLGVWASDGNVVQPDSDKIEIGHVIERPKNEFMNWIQNRQDTGIAYLLQRGIAEWDNQTEYPLHATAEFNGVTYKALNQNVDRQPDLNESNWEIAYLRYADFNEVQETVDSIVNDRGFLPFYVLRSDPIFTGKALGVSYSFLSSPNVGLTSVNNELSVTEDDVVIAKFSEVVEQTDSSVNVATTAWVQDLIKSTFDSIVPIGAMIEYPNGVVPSQNLKFAHGGELSRADYPELFAVIGTRYGVGDGTFTFNLPDKRGRFTREWDNNKGIDTGREIGSVQNGQLEKHKHVQSLGEIYDIAGLFGKSSTKGYQGSSGGLDNDNYLWYTNDGTDYQSATPNEDNPNVIGEETRPTNIALATLIRVK